jgi:hypothetical protein
MQSQDKPNPDRYTWNKGDIEILREGEGEPLLNERDLANILKHSGPPRQRESDKDNSKSTTSG